MEFNVPFQHKYGYIRDDNIQVKTFQSLNFITPFRGFLTRGRSRDRVKMGYPLSRGIPLSNAIGVWDVVVAQKDLEFLFTEVGAF